MKLMFYRTSAFKIITFCLATLLLWLFGLSLLTVILNISIGFTENTADFRTAFVQMTSAKERSYVQEYILLSEKNKSKTESNSLEESLQYYETMFNPQNTNYRFKIIDSDGNELLTNEPSDEENDKILGSHSTSIRIYSQPQSYQKSYVIKNLVDEYDKITFNSMGDYLNDPAEFRTWYFLNESLNDIYNNGLDVFTLDNMYTENMYFDSEDDALKFNYTERFGKHCTWKILTSAAVSQDQTTEVESGKVMVEVSAFRSYNSLHVTLHQYCQMKKNNMQVYAEKESDEQLLSQSQQIIITGNSETERYGILYSYLPEELKVDDNIRANYEVFYFLFRHTEIAVIVLFVSFVLFVLSGICMCSSITVTKVSRFHSFAFEIFYILPPLATISSIVLLIRLYHRGTPYRLLAFFCIGLIFCISASCMLWLYTTTVRTKNNTFWKSFGTYRLFTFFLNLFGNKRSTCLFIFITSTILFVLNAVVVPQVGTLIALPIFAIDFWVLIMLGYCVYAYFELHQHVNRIETGDFTPCNHPIPLIADFKSFERSLTEMTDRIEEIVANQTKMDHLRTELITNVSHDLKTPLTSLVNYVDLLSRENIENENAQKYLEILKNQSSKLKKLVIDLVDASKASTGNIAMELMPTDVSMLLQQIAVEYEDQLAKSSLSLVMNAPDTPVQILSDSRQIWRVFDNLLSNACKYALSGTRVYIDTTVKGDSVMISMKNISSAALDIAPDMLLERFIRGDSSRHTEGSGLGLSIARDLTALQNGVLEIQSDGDLFKALLTFPLYHPTVTEFERSDHKATPLSEE